MCYMRIRDGIPQTYYVLCRLLSNYFTHVIHIVLSRDKLKSNQIKLVIFIKIKMKIFLFWWVVPASLFVLLARHETMCSN